MENNHSLIDVPVALVFFARPDVLKSSFEAIRKARPSTLFLIQDGCRVNRQDDVSKINECREIVEKVDWQCKVYKNYADENLGCGMRVFSGVSWAFQYVDRLAIIEDDCVPSLSFFCFCEELLEKYKDDKRIDMISGMNHLEEYEKTPYDYFFTTTGSIAGWATWKRVWDTIDFNMEYANDLDAERLVANLYGKSLIKRVRAMRTKLNRGERLTSWSLQRGMNMFLNSGLIIVPKRNLMSNIGVTENSANSLSSMRHVPLSLRKLYNLKTFEITFPLKHPKYIINDIEYKNKVDRFMGRSADQKLIRTLESVVYRIFGGDFKSLAKGFKRRFSR